jgi:hypothetical protein
MPIDYQKTVCWFVLAVAPKVAVNVFVNGFLLMDESQNKLGIKTPADTQQSWRRT